MINLIEKNLSFIKQLCVKYKVRKLELFGSAAAEDSFNQQSDLDFLVEFLPLNQGEYADAYFGLLEDIQNLFGKNVDMVMPSAIKNPYFLESINKTRTIVYAA